MTDTAAVRAFIEHWERVELNEKAVAQSHFIDLCRLLGLKGPVEADPKGAFYRFEKPLTKTGGSAGFADVWHKDRFAWEYKTKGKYPNLNAAYQQLLLYKEDLDNPPVLVACDIANYELHISYTGYRTRVEQFTNADLQNAETRELLRLVFSDPEQLRPVERQETITKKAAERFAEVAQFLERRKFAPDAIAHFFMKVLFALFAEDIKLLPAELMSQSIRQAILQPHEFVGRTAALFRAMKVGDYFGRDRVPRFNGWLFDDDSVLPLNADELMFLSDAARLDWSQVEPAIFGTLFERSLNPAKRAQLGAHYTSRDDILLIVEPVLMVPLRREWAEVKQGVAALQAQWAADGLSSNRQRQLKGVAEGMLFEFSERLANVRVLDPACGSGNFLYVALTTLKDLEKEVWSYAGGLGLQQPTLSVAPRQLYGIEKNPFAAELAQVVVWIGYLQWKRANGFFDVEEPILQSLHNIECRDAILAFDAAGNPSEPAWPAADVIVGNPPFLGGNRIRKGLGDAYVDTIFTLYEGRVPAFADLVCYWFERTRTLISERKVLRAGLLATQGIRGGANRRVLERIKETGDIFWAQSDRNWVLDGAMVHVSMVGFDDGVTKVRELDGQSVTAINADLTASVDLTTSPRLLENRGICFQGASAKAPFDIDSEIAANLLAEINQNGKSNSDVIRPVKGALELVSSLKPKWTIDFGLMLFEEASAYQAPFTYVEEYVLPVRMKRRADYRGKWWQYGRPRPEMRNTLAGLSRYIATPAHSKHRLFVWVTPDVLCNQATLVFAREDDFFLGVLHSNLHEIWARAKGTQLREAESGFRYTPTTTFETFPFPWPPGQEDQGDPRVLAIAEAARELVRLRDAWLNPSDDELARSGGKLKDRTLTNLYNKRPDWLAEAHRRLDTAVFDAYEWPHGLSDDEILARLLALNLERAARQGAVPQLPTEEANDEAE